MTNESTRLARTDCPLIPEGELPLVDRYNACLDNLAALRTEAAGLDKFPERIVELERSMGEARAKLSRQHYRVGFLGTTGAGKSTTFNNILKVSAENAPAKSGGGEATSAAPARLRRNDGGEASVQLRFMTDAEYKRRKNRLAERLRLGSELTEDDQLGKCEEMRTRLENRELIPEMQLPDVIALEALIQSRRKYPGYVSSGPRVVKPGVWALRSEYLNHPFHPNQKVVPTAAENRLFWEVAIDFPNDFLPHTLEMVDLPGLGATSFHDTCVTLDIIENTDGDGLDGAMLFIRCDQLSDDSIVTIIQKLQSTWGKRFQGRVWAVFTKFDALADPHYHNTPNFFSSVDKLIRDADITGDCVFIVCNEIAKHHGKRLQTGASDDERIAASEDKLSRDLDDPILKKHFADYPYFEPIVREVYLNGGLNRLREAIVNRLGEMIGREVADDVRTKISRVESDIDSARKLAKRRKTQTSQDRENAITCAKALNRLILKCRSELPELRKSTLAVRDGMRNTIPKNSPVDDLADIPAQDIPGTFLRLASALDEETHRLVINEAVEPIYSAIAKEFAPLPTVPLTAAESVQSAWANAHETDSEIDNWQGELPRFYDRELIDQLCTVADRMRGPQFKALLDSKIHAVAHVGLFRIRERVMNRLGTLAGELNLLVSGPLPERSFDANH